MSEGRCQPRTTARPSRPLLTCIAGLLYLALGGCGDDAGGGEEMGGADQAQSTDDPNGTADRDRVENAMDAVSDGMPAVALGGPDLGSTTSVGPTCIDHPELVPEDAGSDPCRRCYIEHCCDNNALIFSCIVEPVPAACSESGQFGRIQQCFAAERAADDEAESWDLVAGCVLAERDPIDADSGTPFSFDAGELPLVWPWWNDTSAIELTRCIVGTLPVEDVPDGGIGPIREAFLSRHYFVDPDRDSYPAPSCAAECFEGWR